MHTGLFFGSFNPIHNGHRNVIQQTIEAGYFDRAIVIVSPQSPFKRQSDLAPETSRLEMCKLALMDLSNVEVSDIELRLPKPSYTINTLRSLSKLLVGQKLSIVLGMDQAERFMEWKEVESILQLCNVFFYPRPGYSAPTGWSYTLLEGIRMDISSSQIRERIKQGLDISELVHPAVHRYISRHELYRDI